MSDQHSEHTAQVIDSLKKFLRGGFAHATFEDAVKDLPAASRGIVPDGLPYSVWQLVEHIRIDQWDILDFSRNPEYVGVEWPKDYWPKETAPKDDEEWEKSLRKIKEDLEAFIALLEDPNVDMYKPFPWGKGQTLLREAVLMIDHTSYHIGQLIVVRRLIGEWKK